MFKSTDAGATWSAILSAAPHSPADGVLSFAIDPVTFNALYVTRGYSDGDWGQSDVYKSADGGSSWSWIANLWDAALFLVAIERRSDPLAPATLWGLYYYGLLKSTDGGPTWTDMNPMPESLFEVMAPLQRKGKVEDLVGAYRFLMSDESRYLTGQAITIDGGITAGLTQAQLGLLAGAAA